MKTNKWDGGISGNLYLSVCDSRGNDVILNENEIIELYGITGKMAADIINSRARKEDDHSEEDE